MTPNVLYGIYYVCRLSMNIVRKPIVEEGVFSETELGIIGSCLFFVYAVGKLTNGFLADRSNVRRFMSTDLLCQDTSNTYDIVRVVSSIEILKESAFLHKKTAC